MRAFIVYDTKTGMTEKVAQAISSGMKEVGFNDIVIKKAEDATEDDFKSAEAWIVGSPTHIGGPTGTTKKALKMGTNSGTAGKMGTAFDTRFANANKGAINKLKAMMEESGVKLIMEPEWFSVTKTSGPLGEGEEAKAATFGRKIAGALRP